MRRWVLGIAALASRRVQVFAERRLVRSAKFQEYFPWMMILFGGY
jgi:hypothetical protein